MRRMLRAELVKFGRSRVLWIILGVMLVSAGIAVFTGAYNSAETALTSISKDSMVLLLAAAIYSGLLLPDDFMNGLVRHFVAAGYRRSAIVTAKGVHYMAGCILLAFLYPLLAVLLTGAVRGFTTSAAEVIGQLCGVFLRSLPLYSALFAVFFLIAMLVQQGAVATGISVTFSILFVVFTNTLSSGSGNGLLASILKLNPVVQLQQVAQGRPLTGEYWLCAALSLTCIGLFWLISTVRFQREEL